MTPLFSITGKDVEWQFFRSGGNGGQNQNKVSSGARCIHAPSGAIGEARDTRSQLDNRRLAWRRMAESAAMQAWIKKESNRLMGHKSVDEIVNEQMAEENLLVETYDPQRT